jgi:hypothetical protein
MNGSAAPQANQSDKKYITFRGFVKKKIAKKRRGMFVFVSEKYLLWRTFAIIGVHINERDISHAKTQIRVCTGGDFSGGCRGGCATGNDKTGGKDQD